MDDSGAACDSSTSWNVNEVQGRDSLSVSGQHFTYIFVNNLLNLSKTTNIIGRLCYGNYVV